LISEPAQMADVFDRLKNAIVARYTIEWGYCWIGPELYLYKTVVNPL